MPGPLVEANEGDNLVCQSSLRFCLHFCSLILYLWIVNIVNNLSNDTTSIVSEFIQYLQHACVFIYVLCLAF
jgi:hypothetical protein